MSTELATTNQDTTLLHLGFSEGEPVKPVNLSLIQPINASADEGTIAGRFCDSQSNMQFEDLQVVIFEVRNGRVMFPPGGGLGEKPICRSADGLLPVINDDLVRQDDGNGCIRCQYGPKSWKSIGGKKIKPACQETRTVLMAELSTGFVYRMNAKGTHVAPVDDLKETIRKFYIRTKVAGKPVFPYAMTFKMSSVKVAGKKGTFYIPKFSPPSIVPEDRVDEFKDLFEKLVLRKGVDYADAPDGPADAVGAVLEGEYEPQQYEAA